MRWGLLEVIRLDELIMVATSGIDLLPFLELRKLVSPLWPPSERTQGEVNGLPPGRGSSQNLTMLVP